MKKIFLFLLIITSTANYSQKSVIFYNFNTKKYSLEDLDSGRIISEEYDEIYSKNNNYITTQNNKTGIIDENGKIVLDFVYDKIYTFSEGFYLLAKGRKRGLCDLNFKELLPIEYNRISVYKSYIAAVKDNKLGAFDLKGKLIIPFEYELSRMTEPTYFRFNKNNKAGLIDSLNNTIIPFEYSWIEKFSNRSLDFDYKPDNQFMANNLYCAIKEDNNHKLTAGVFNNKGENIIPVIYENVYSVFSNNLIGVKLNKKAGFINLKNKIVIPLSYDEALPFNDDVSSVKLGNKYGVINDKNEFIVPMNLYADHFVFKNGLSKFNSYKNNQRKYGFINNQGKIMIPEIYDEAEYLSTGHFRVKKDGKYGIVALTGIEIIPPIYDGIIVFGYKENEKDKFILIKDKKYGIIDAENNIIIPFKYDYIDNFGNMILVAKDNLYGFYNEKFELAIPTIYLNVKHTNHSKRISVLDKNNLCYNINEKGIRTTKSN